MDGWWWPFHGCLQCYNLLAHIGSLSTFRDASPRPGKRFGFISLSTHWKQAGQSAKNHSWFVVSIHFSQILVKLDHFPKEGWKFKKYLKPPPRQQIIAHLQSFQYSFGRPSFNDRIDAALLRDFHQCVAVSTSGAEDKINASLKTPKKTGDGVSIPLNGFLDPHWPKWLMNGGDPNHLLTGMILQGFWPNEIIFHQPRFPWREFPY